MNLYKNLYLTLLLYNLGCFYNLLSHPKDNETPPFNPGSFKKIEELDKKGDKLFKVVPNWGPHKPGAMHGGVVVDKKGNVYFSRVRQGMVVLNKNGEKIGEWSKESAGIHGMNLYEKDGETFVVGAFNHHAKVASFNLKGEKQWEITLYGDLKKYYEGFFFRKLWKYEKKNSNKQLKLVSMKFNPTSVAVTSDGSCYIADGYGQSLIHAFSPERKYLHSFAGKGLAIDELQNCHGITATFIDDKEVLLVSDRHRGRLVVYSLDGKYLYTALRDLPLPCAVSINPNDGRIAVAGLIGSVSIYDSKFKPLCRLGVTIGAPKPTASPDPDEFPEGRPLSVHDVTWDKEGGIIATSWNNFGRIDYWKPTGAK